MIPLTDHERRVRTMMQSFRQATPDSPTMPEAALRAARVALLLEEVVEFADESAIVIQVLVGNDAVLLQPRRVPVGHVAADTDGCWTLVEDESREPCLVGMADALADISVVNTGAFVACGIRMTPLLECVDANNLLKVATGRLNEETGKFEKHPNHPKPNFAYELKLQGYQPG